MRRIREKKFIRIDTLLRGSFFFYTKQRNDDFHISSPFLLFLRVFLAKYTSNLSSSPLLTNFLRFCETVGNYRSRRFALAAVSL